VVGLAGGDRADGVIVPEDRAETDLEGAAGGGDCGAAAYAEAVGVGVAVAVAVAVAVGVGVGVAELLGLIASL
jgi:hypothetical protein